MPDITTYQKAMANVMSRKINDDLEKAIPPIDVDWIRKAAGNRHVYIQIGGTSIEVGEIHATICQKVIEDIAVEYYKELAEKSPNSYWHGLSMKPDVDTKWKNSSVDVILQLDDGTICVGYYCFDDKAWVPRYYDGIEKPVAWRSIT